MKFESSWSWYAAIVTLLLAVALTLSTARVKWYRGDASSTLLVSQSIAREGTIRVDSVGVQQLRTYKYKVHHKHGHYYGYFPLGSSVIGVPVVAAMNALGKDVTDAGDDALGQRIVVLLSQLTTLIFLLRIARCYLSRTWSLVTAGAFWFGTSLASTNGTALWSHGPSSLFGLIAIDIALRTTGQSRSRGYWLGACLFMAYFCRPTFALLAPAILLYTWFHSRSTAYKAALSLAAWMLAFIGFSVREFDQLLPDYYLPARVSRSNTFWTALRAHTISPSRGLFVFTPLLWLPLLFLRASIAGLRSNRWLTLIAVVWPVLHLLTIARFSHWWAGYSFGPRFCTDLLPGLFVLLCASLRSAVDSTRWLVPAFIVTAAASCWIHTYQGLYNRATQQWNAKPSIDQDHNLVFDWKYPQFLHTAERQAARVAEYAERKAAEEDSP